MPYIKRNKLEALLFAGSMLSNIAFNGKQDSRIPEDYKGSMGKYQREWDKARSELTEGASK